MPNAITIRILEKDNNRRGDLFGRLMNDLFLSLGYDDGGIQSLGPVGDGGGRP